LATRLELDFEVLAPDRIGYGSTTGEARGLAANAEMAAALLRKRRSGPTTVVAHSWAGGAAVLLAGRHPELVDCLVLVGAACTPDSVNRLDHWLTVPGLGDVLTVVGLAGLGSILPRVRRLVLPLLPARLRDPVAVTLPDRNALGGAEGAWGRQRRSFMIEQRALLDELPAVTAALSSLDLPVAVVCGQWDVVVPAAAAVSLARAVPGAALTVVPRAGHFVFRDDPDALAGVIRELARSASAGRPAPPLS
jgi:pimeloyl-ACP methyl ester carboxylesterase